MSSSRVLIPNNVRNMIQDIREITGKHSDEDIYTVLKDCNMDPNETAQRLLYLDTFHEVKRKRDPRKVNLNNRVYEESRWTTGTQGRGARGGRGNYSSSYFSHGAGGGRNVSARKENGVSNSMERGFKPSLSVPEKTKNNANPHVTKSSTISVNGPTHVPDGSSSYERGTQSSAGVYSSTSDPVVVAPLSSQIPSVGAIKCEINSQRIDAESGAFNPSGKRSSKLKESQILEKNQPLEPSKVVASEAPTLAVEAVLQSLPDVSFLEEATSKVDMKLEKFKISTRQPVIFPDHLQVPEDFKNGLIFGSLDATFEESVAYVDGTDDMKSSMPAIESFEGNDKVANETFSSNPIVFSTAHEEDYPNNPHSLPHEPDNSSPVKDGVSSGTAPEFDQSKQENMLPQVGPQYPFVHTAPSYGFPYIQPMLGSQLVQCEGSEIQSGNSPVSSTSDSKATATQPIGQSSIPISPPPFPVFRQPYPVNYFPFGAYFPPFYLATNAPQFLGHSGFPQQPSTGNVYLSPIVAAAAGPGVKFSVPQNKAGHNAGNLTHFGIPSGFGSYNPSLAVNSGSSAGNEDLTASELKENSVHTTVQQGEGPLVWFPGRDIPSLHANSFYNHIPPGQHIAFSPLQAGHAPFAGIYHPAQTMASSSTARPL
ncbi:GBF-interacting protein 1-like [Camellia lanceoleosa]|nr:GBF-interacting protein 1-like [Camellia lanceoleosa]